MNNLVYDKNTTVKSRDSPGRCGNLHLIDNKNT
jgi:hypothetical protein